MYFMIIHSDFTNCAQYPELRELRGPRTSRFDLQHVRIYVCFIYDKDMLKSEMLRVTIAYRI